MNLRKKKRNNMLIFIIFLFIFLILLFVVRETVHAVFCFILVIFNLVGLLFLLNLDFLALLILLIYVGAIVVLFLFVSMLLNMKTTFSNHKTGYYFITFIGVVLFLLLKGVLLLGSIGGLDVIPSTMSPINKENLMLFSVVSISEHLYSVYAPFLIISAFILLIALIGSVLLTLQSAN
jgi:NADH-quinone oxidoreductase subunit J